MKSIYKPIGNRGFTLIEVLIAGFLLVVAILGVISTTVIIIKSNSLSKEMTTATTLAKDKMEGVKNSAATAAGYNALAGGGSETGLETIYTRTWTVTNDGSPAAGMKAIEVKVLWSWQSASHNVTLNTIVAK
jgi:type IV pilus assembly protein PilV